VSRLLFDDLPSWYKPDLNVADGYVTSDARALPFADDSVDYIFTDPPYGKNLNHAGIGTFYGSISEMNRVSRIGSMVLIPVSWLSELDEAGIVYTQLTKDVSKGTSNFPVCYVMLESSQNNH